MAQSTDGITLDELQQKADEQAEEIEKLKQREKEFIGNANGTATLSVRSLDITDLEGALSYSNVDLDKYEVERYIVNSWETTISAAKTGTGKNETFTNYQVKVWLKPKIKNDLEEAIKIYAANISKYRIKKTTRRKKSSGVALEMALLDAHLGKLAWLEETGYRNYDTGIAVEDYNYAVDYNLNASAWARPEKIFYIVGQDLFHVDNMEGKTTHGQHAMDVDGRMPKIYEKAFRIVTESIYKCREVAPTEVIWSPGNHDYLASMFFMLCAA